MASEPDYGEIFDTGPKKRNVMHIKVEKLDMMRTLQVGEEETTLDKA